MKELLESLKNIPANPNPPAETEIADFRREEAKGKPKKRRKV